MKDFTYQDLETAILEITSKAELQQLKRIVVLMALDDHFTDKQVLRLLEYIGYFEKCFRFLDEKMPHDFYPFFSLEAHIKYAADVFSLNAIILHLLIHEKEYQRQGWTAEKIYAVRESAIMKAYNF